jgi:hypothetical protein
MSPECGIDFRIRIGVDFFLVWMIRLVAHDEQGAVWPALATSAKGDVNLAGKGAASPTVGDTRNKGATVLARMAMIKGRLIRV